MARAVTSRRRERVSAEFTAEVLRSREREYRVFVMVRREDWSAESQVDHAGFQHNYSASRLASRRSLR